MRELWNELKETVYFVVVVEWFLTLDEEASA